MSKNSKKNLEKKLSVQYVWQQFSNHVKHVNRYLHNLKYQNVKNFWGEFIAASIISIAPKERL